MVRDIRATSTTWWWWWWWWLMLDMYSWNHSTVYKLVLNRNTWFLIAAGKTFFKKQLRKKCKYQCNFNVIPNFYTLNISWQVDMPLNQPIDQLPDFLVCLSNERGGRFLFPSHKCSWEKHDLILSSPSSYLFCQQSKEYTDCIPCRGVEPPP